MNLNEEIRNGYCISKEMKCVWTIQLQMLIILLDVCKRNNLRIWADSGTLLGCVRHGGYIPWDDDIDMIMLREDYDKLIEIAPKEIKKPYYFQSAATEKHPYPIGHAQLRMDGTSAILPDAKRHRYHQGIFIDIFILDNVPNDIEVIKKFSTAIDIKKNDFYQVCTPMNFTTNVYAFLEKLYKQLRWRDFYMSFEQEIKRFFNSGETRIANLSLTHDIKRMTDKSFPEEWYEETVMLPFEDILMPCPAHYDDILRTLYGDYMTPVHAPTMHGGYEVLDTKRSYKAYLKQYRREYYKEAINSFVNK